jgi:hypothetical protein
MYTHPIWPCPAPLVGALNALRQICVFVVPSFLRFCLLLRFLPTCLVGYLSYLTDNEWRQPTSRTHSACIIAFLVLSEVSLPFTDLCLLYLIGRAAVTR